MKSRRRTLLIAKDEQSTSEDDLERGLHSKLEGKERAEWIVPYLAARSYHIPGNSWFQDWWQFVYANNHPIFGLCCHDRQHPVTNGTRILVFLGTLSSSLAIFNLFYLYFFWKGEADAIAISSNVTISSDDDYLDVRSVVVHKWQIYLWTLGALFLSIYNTSIWTVAACAICAPGGRFANLSHMRWVGKILVFVIVFATTAIAVILVIYRANIESDTVIEKDFNGVVQQIDIQNAWRPQANMYLKAWAVQLALSTFVYDAIISTVFFSGILACGGDFPILGGRPYEKRKEIQRLAKERRRSRRSIRERVRLSITADDRSTQSDEEAEAFMKERRKSKRDSIQSSRSQKRSFKLDAASRRSKRLSVEKSMLRRPSRDSRKSKRDSSDDSTSVDSGDLLSDSSDESDVEAQKLVKERRRSKRTSNAMEMDKARRRRNSSFKDDKTRKRVSADDLGRTSMTRERRRKSKRDSTAAIKSSSDDDSSMESIESGDEAPLSAKERRKRRKSKRDSTAAIKNSSDGDSSMESTESGDEAPLSAKERRKRNDDRSSRKLASTNDPGRTSMKREGRRKSKRVSSATIGSNVDGDSANESTKSDEVEAETSSKDLSKDKGNDESSRKKKTRIKVGDGSRKGDYVDDEFRLSKVEVRRQSKRDSSVGRNSDPDGNSSNEPDESNEGAQEAAKEQRKRTKADERSRETLSIDDPGKVSEKVQGRRKSKRDSAATVDANVERYARNESTETDDDIQESAKANRKSNDVSVGLKKGEASLSRKASLKVDASAVMPESIDDPDRTLVKLEGRRKSKGDSPEVAQESTKERRKSKRVSAAFKEDTQTSTKALLKMSGGDEIDVAQANTRRKSGKIEGDIGVVSKEVQTRSSGGQRKSKRDSTAASDVNLDGHSLTEITPSDKVAKESTKERRRSKRLSAAFNEDTRTSSKAWLKTTESEGADAKASDAVAQSNKRTKRGKIEGENDALPKDEQTSSSTTPTTAIASEDSMQKSKGLPSRESVSSDKEPTETLRKPGGRRVSKRAPTVPGSMPSSDAIEQFESKGASADGVQPNDDAKGRRVSETNPKDSKKQSATSAKDPPEDSDTRVKSPKKKKLKRDDKTEEGVGIVLEGGAQLVEKDVRKKKKEKKKRQKKDDSHGRVGKSTKFDQVTGDVKGTETTKADIDASRESSEGSSIKAPQSDDEDTEAAK